MTHAFPEGTAVLVIDDDPDICLMIATGLLKHGIHVITAGSAEAGLEQLPYGTFDVAFLDQNLPGMAGLVLGEYLRRNNPHMKIAMVTGESSERLQRLSAAQDIVFIPKPFELSQLLDVITEAQTETRRRQAAQDAAESPAYVARPGAHGRALRDTYAMPRISARIQSRLVRTIKAALSRLRNQGEHWAVDRSVALAGLLTAQVLNLELPRTRDGKSLFEEYDALMHADGRRTEFNEEPP